MEKLTPKQWIESEYVDGEGKELLLSNLPDKLVDLMDGYAKYYHDEKMETRTIKKTCRCAFDFGTTYVKKEVCNNCRKPKK